MSHGYKHKPLVGVAMGTAPALMVPLKQAFLFFDRVGVVELRGMLAARKAPLLAYPNTLSDVTWLNEKGFLFHIDSRLSQALSEDDAGRRALLSAGEATDRHERVWNRVSAIGANRDFRATIEAVNEATTAALTSRSFVCRAFAISLRLENAVDAVSLLPLPETDSRQNPEPRNMVIRVILDSLPIPDDSVPWEQLCDFRADEDGLNRLLALRVWASETARAVSNPFEIREKLDFLLNDYAQRLAKHRLRTRGGCMEIVLNTTLEVAEHLGNMKFGSALKTVVGIRGEHATLLLAETDIPGREVSYVIHARDRFP